MTILTRLWHGWLRVGQFIGDWIGRVVLTVFYGTIFAPFGLGVRLFSDPLRVKATSDRFWTERAAEPDSLKRARRQF